MHQADGVVQMPLAKREPGVLRFLGDFEVFVEGIFEIEADHFAARRGDVAHHEAAQVERVDEDFLAQRRDALGVFALGEDHPQLLLAVAEFMRSRRFHPEHVF